MPVVIARTQNTHRQHHGDFGPRFIWNGTDLTRQAIQTNGSAPDRGRKSFSPTSPHQQTQGNLCFVEMVAQSGFRTGDVMHAHVFDGAQNERFFFLNLLRGAVAGEGFRAVDLDP